VKRPRTLIAASATLIVLAAIVLGGLALAGSGDDDTTENPAPRDAIEAPTETATPPSGAGGLPPQFVQCMADQGYAIESPDDIHTAPPQVLQACFGSLHGGG
jgi:hypothetical protein